MIVYGRNPVREALRGQRAVQRVWATDNAAREPWLASVGPRIGGGLLITAAEELEQLCGSSAHQGVCADASAYPYADADGILSRDRRLILALDQVQDPQNLGSICRTAECAGVAGVVIPERRTAEVTPAVCKASAGAVEHLKIARVRNLADFLVAAKEQGRWVYGADSSSEVSYGDVAYGDDTVLVLGSEGRGLRPRVAAQCDALVAIPLRGRIESLSVSAAAAVLVYAASGGA